MEYKLDSHIRKVVLCIKKRERNYTEYGGKTHMTNIYKHEVFIEKGMKTKI